MDAILFYVVSFLMLFGFAALYIKVTPYNELEAMQDGKLVPLLPLLGALISVTAVIVAAQMIAHNLLGTVMIGLGDGCDSTGSISRHRTTAIRHGTVTRTTARTWQSMCCYS